MSKNQDNKQAELRPYEADGIQECDNPLPKWWVGLFLGTMIFGVVYIGYYHFLDGVDHLEYFNNFMEARNQADAGETVSAGDLEAKLNNPELAAAGLEDYTVNCLPCHGAQGEGVIGPNLTDNYWVHGSDAASIIKVVEEGVLEKGMPPWKDVLGKKKIEQLTALIISWRGKNIPGKEPQGELAE